MDISPGRAPVGRQLLWLGVAATVFTGAVVAAGAVIVLSGELVFDSLNVTPFRGWQVYATMTGLAILVTLVGVVAIRLLVRTFRRLRDRTPHRRAVITAAVLPGIWIGGFVLSPMTSAVSWAADHTSDAAAAQRQLDGMFLDSPVRPPLFPSDHPAADGATAARLLHATDLGAGWWDADTPNPVALKPPTIATLATGAARTVLSEQHRVSGAWHVDRMIMESETGFRTTDDARRYVLDAQRLSPPSDTSPVNRINRTLGGVQVWETSSKSGLTARFVVGATAFSLTTDVHSTDQATYDRILTRAITRATTAR